MTETPLTTTRCKDLPKCGYFVGKGVPAGCCGVLSRLMHLAIALHAKHYPEVTQWEPLRGDMGGLISQIDNMTAGLSRAETPRITSELGLPQAVNLTAQANNLLARIRELETENRALRASPRIDGRPSECVRLRESNEALVKALETVLGLLDDPTGNEHIRDMRAASHVARTAIANATESPTQGELK
jgi:hypothetical protein